MKYLLSLVLLLSSSVFGATPLAFVSPHGGEVYTVGTTQPVVVQKNTYKSITVEVSRDGGTTYSVLGTIDNTVKNRLLRNVFNWNVSGSACNNCKLRLSSVLKSRGKNVMVVGYSNTFSVGGVLGVNGKDGVSPAISDVITALLANSDFMSKVKGPKGDDGISVDSNTLVIALSNDPSFILNIVNTLKHDQDFVNACKGGPKGDKGDKGLTGATGSQGAVGPVGPAGKNGTTPVIDINVIVTNIINNTIFITNLVKQLGDCDDFVNKCKSH